MITLKRNPTLNDIQNYVAEIGVKRKRGHEDIAKKFLMLVGEIGELITADRKNL